MGRSSGMARLHACNTKLCQASDELSGFASGKPIASAPRQPAQSFPCIPLPYPDPDNLLALQGKIEVKRERLRERGRKLTRIKSHATAKGFGSRHKAMMMLNGIQISAPIHMLRAKRCSNHFIAPRMFPARVTSTPATLQPPPQDNYAIPTISRPHKKIESMELQCLPDILCAGRKLCTLFLCLLWYRPENLGFLPDGVEAHNK